MDELPGSVGTSASFALRMGQTIFSSASLLFMSLGVQFYSYTSFSFLVTIMGLVIPWSFTLALVDVYSMLVKCRVRQQGILLIIVLGDLVRPVGLRGFSLPISKIVLVLKFLNHELQALSVLTLAAACSTTSAVDLLSSTDGPYCPPKICNRYLISAVMAFLSWFLSVVSFLFNLWLLPSL